MDALHLKVVERVQANLVDGRLDLYRLYAVLVEVIADGALDMRDHETLSLLAEDLFEKYVRPQSLPNFVDNIIKAQIRPTLAQLLPVRT